MKTKSFSYAATPVDNKRLAHLCGALDQNLRQIETGLDVLIQRRNHKFSISGAQPENCKQALALLARLYEQADHVLSVDDVQLSLVELRTQPLAALDADAPLPEDEPLCAPKKQNYVGALPRSVLISKPF